MHKNKRLRKSAELAKLDSKMDLFDVLTSKAAKTVKQDMELEKYARVRRDVSMAEFVQFLKPQSGEQA